MASHKIKIRRLAASLCSGVWRGDAVRDRVTRALHGGPPDPARLTARLLLRFDAHQPPTAAEMEAMLAGDAEVRAALDRSDDPDLPAILLDPPVMHPPADRRISLPLPRIETWRDLRQWLGVFDGELAWFADREGRQADVVEPRLHHYRYRWLAKPAGGWRLIEQPKTRLKAIQRQILRGVLDRVPPHPAAHGFRRAHSCRSHAAVHTGRAVVLRMDLQHFFTSVPVARIGAMFRRLGYPAGVAHLLQSLCTHCLSPPLAAAPDGALNWEQRQRLRAKHLPQGAPTSPALANLCAWRLDCRLDGLARRFGLDYSRYADDLAFSGPHGLVANVDFIEGMVGAIALEEGFRVNHRKTHLATRSQCQRLTGIVVNARPNLDRRAFDRLRATLHNCARYGPAGQNRDGVADFRAHLAGRLAYARWLNPDKARRLERLWRQIDWPSDGD